MKSFSTFIGLLACLAGTSVQAATKEQWRGRSMYQIVTDRFSQPTPEQALTKDLVANCDPKAGSWCGGNWRSIIDKLDYIRDMGFTAIWISPINQNIDVITPWEAATHGYWVNDITKLNARFGTPEDLKALIQAAHDRGIYVMVDIVINHIATTPGKPTVQEMLDADPLMMYRNFDDYHNPYCIIRDWTNMPEARNCSLGDTKVALVDVNTDSASVKATLNTWISGLVKEYQIDGLRLDAAKHISPESLKEFCDAAGVLCMGEIYTSVSNDVTPYTNGFIDSVHSYPLYDGLKRAFRTGSKGFNIQGFVDKLREQQNLIQDPSVLGTFLSNHDNSRWYAVNQDLQVGQNAFVSAMMVEGIPTVYYGDEQELAYGMDDPDNRQALWSNIGGIGTSTYPTDKLTYKTIKRLNQIKAYMSTLAGFDTEFAKPLTKGSTTDVAMKRGRAVFAVTNRGAGATEGTLKVNNHNFNSTVVDMLTCATYELNSDKSLDVNFAGGMPFVFFAIEDATSSGICPDLPGAASSAVVPSSAIATATLSTAALDSGHSVLPAGTTALGGTVSAMPQSMHLGDSAVLTATGGSSVLTEGALSIPGGAVAEGSSQGAPIATTNAQASEQTGTVVELQAGAPVTVTSSGLGQSPSGTQPPQLANGAQTPGSQVALIVTMLFAIAYDFL